VSWPDVSSWYWDTARPFSAVPPTAIAITVYASTSVRPLPPAIRETQ
jgi:hypothetical protein